MPSLTEMLKNPCDNLSLICFLGFAICGGIMFIVALVGESVGYPSALFLIILGFWASYEIRMIAALRKELNELENVKKELEEQVERLGGEVKRYDEENERFKGETEELKVANQKFQGEVDELKQTSDELEQTKNEFETHNKDLDEQVESIEEANKGMQTNLEKLTKQTDELEAQYEQFSKLQKSIQKYAEENEMEMAQALEQQNKLFHKLERLMGDNASTLLQQIASDMEFEDQEEGMSKKEYDEWFARIPRRFQDEIKKRGITFA
eukprot:UN34519